MHTVAQHDSPHLLCCTNMIVLVLNCNLTICLQNDEGWYGNHVVQLPLVCNTCDVPKTSWTRLASTQQIMCCLPSAFVGVHHTFPQVQTNTAFEHNQHHRAMRLFFLSCCVLVLCGLSHHLFKNTPQLARAVHGRLFESKNLRQMVAKSSGWMLYGSKGKCTHIETHVKRLSTPPPRASLQHASHHTATGDKQTHHYTMNLA